MTLRVGAALKDKQAKALGLPGTWSVWSQAGDAPGAHFILPADDQARALGVKYVVVRVVQRRDSVEPELSLIRSDPHKPQLFTTTKNGARR